MTIWRMRIVFWKPKAKNTHSEYVIFIDFPLQQWLQEGVSMIRYTYIDCLFGTDRKRFLTCVRIVSFFFTRLSLKFRATK